MALFIAIPIVGVVTPFLALPALTSAYGGTGWAAIAIGQSIGMAGATIVELGWALNGPQRVARAVGNRRKYFALALRTKIVVFPLVAVVALIVAMLISPAYQVAAGIQAAALTATGLMATWYFVGIGQPGVILLAESLPRLIGAVAGAIATLLGAPIWVFPIVSFAFPVLVGLPAMTWMAGVRVHDLFAVRRVEVVRALAYQRVAMSGRLVSSLYISMPTALVGVVSPSNVAVFSAAERLMRMGLTVLASVPNALQGWVGRHTAKDMRMRVAMRAVAINSGMGLFAGIAYALIAPPFSQWIFSGVATIPVELAMIAGALVLVVCVSRATGGIALVAARKVKWITASATIGAAVGVPAILSFAAAWGAVGGMLGALVAELAVLATQLIALYSNNRGGNLFPVKRRDVSGVSAPE